MKDRGLAKLTLPEPEKPLAQQAGTQAIQKTVSASRS